MIRMATREDAAELLEIYRAFILNTDITQETELPSVNEFQERIVSTLKERPWLVCVIDDHVAGYAYAGKHRERSGYQWCTEPSVYVSENFYRFGVANALYTALFDILKLQGYINAYAVITLPNERSVAFHEKFGFQYFTTYKKIGYKLGQWHDVGWWQYDVNSHVDDPKDPVKLPEVAQSAIDDILARSSALLKK